MDVTKIAKSAGSAALMRPCAYYRAAREGMGALLDTFDSPRVLMPAYIGWSSREGSGVFDPVSQRGLEVDFYNVDAGLSVDVADVTARLDRGHFDVLVIIHYFGRTDPGISQVAEAARQRGVFLVEDLAHAFFTEWCGGGAGRWGDANLYSLHKMFPMDQGGMLAYRDLDRFRRLAGTELDYSHRLLGFDWSAIAERRRTNYGELSERLRAAPRYGQEFTLLWDEFPAEDVPQTLPLRILKGDRDRLYELLNESGLGVVSLYHTLINPVQGHYPVAEEVSRTIMNLPVHQDITARDYDFIAETFLNRLKVLND